MVGLGVGPVLSGECGVGEGVVGWTGALSSLVLAAELSTPRPSPLPPYPTDFYGMGATFQGFWE